MKRLLRRLRDQQGVTMAEYALILALVAIVGIAAWQLLGSNITTKVNTAATTIGAAS